MSKPTPRELEMRSLVREHDRHGLTWEELAEREEIALGTLSWWRSEIRRRDRERGTEPDDVFVEVDFAGAAVDLATNAFELEFVDGRRLRIPAGFDATDLRRLLAVVEAPC